MLYIPKIVNYLEIFTFKEFKDFAVKNLNEFFKSTRRIIFQVRQSIVESFYTFLAMSDKGEKDVALVDKTEAKIIMQACSSVYCVRDYNIEI